MRKNYRKWILAVCMMACIGGACTACTTDTENKQNTKHPSIHERQEPTNEEQGGESSEMIEKEIEMESDSGQKIEYSLEGSAGDDDTKSDENQQGKTKSE